MHNYHYSRHYFLVGFLITAMTISSIYAVEIKNVSSTLIDKASSQVMVTVPVAPGDYIYKEYITLSTDNPDIVVESYSIPSDHVVVYDPTFKEEKVAYDRPFSLSFLVKSTTYLPEDAQFYLSYYTQKNKKMAHDIFSITFAPPQNPVQTSIETDTTDSVHTKTEDKAEQIASCAAEKKLSSSWKSWRATLTARATSFVQTTDSWVIRILFVLLLGLLMSLTPCIYPMIPITVGILQSQGSSSAWRNFLLSLSYSLGIATTFAFLGLIAAFTKQAFGSLMAQPFFVLCVVALLIYLGLSMVGLYDMYIPRVFRPKQHNVKGGSFVSAYIFGAISGTFASPCLSPGLFVLITLVTAWGSKLLGFILLFVFGIGLSIPLMIIGSFSGSLAILPRAGMWMIEMKRIFGFIILGVSCYFLKNIMPYNAVLFLLACFIMSVGIFYLYSARQSHTNRWKIIKNIIGICLIASSVFVFVRAYQYKEPVNELWQHDYYQALKQAKEENKKLLVDIGAPFCSICKAIDTGIFSQSEVIKALALCTTVKIDGSAENEACCTLRDKYSIIGFPTILLIDPHTEEVIKKWGSELYDLSPQEFITELQQEHVSEQK